MICTTLFLCHVRIHIPSGPAIHLYWYLDAIPKTEQKAGLLWPNLCQNQIIAISLRSSFELSCAAESAWCLVRYSGICCARNCLPILMLNLNKYCLLWIQNPSTIPPYSGYVPQHSSNSSSFCAFFHWPMHGFSIWRSIVSIPAFAADFCSHFA